jgi:hypothetical protein
MQMLDDHLIVLMEKGAITREMAREKAFEKRRFN